MFKSAIVVFLTCLLISGSTLAGGIKYITTEDLHKRCKSSLEGAHFNDSYCAAFIEGYLGGVSVYGIFVYSETNKEQREELQKSLEGRDDYFCIPNDTESTQIIAEDIVNIISRYKSEEKIMVALPGNAASGLSVALSLAYPCVKDEK